jgi:hypothetical protein
MKKEMKQLDLKVNSYFSNCLWNGPWTTIRRIPKKFPYSNSNHSSLELKIKVKYGSLSMSSVNQYLIQVWTINIWIKKLDIEVDLYGTF